MILAFTRNLHLAIRQQSNNKWDTSGTFTELAGKTIVIVGVGQIGSHTARVAQAFGMRTVGSVIPANPILMWKRCIRSISSMKRWLKVIIS